MLTIVMIKWKGKRQPMALLEGKETYAKARACEYAEGGYAPRYPVPACEIDNLLSLPAERFTFYSKRIVLWWEQL